MEICCGDVPVNTALVIYRSKNRHIEVKLDYVGEK